MHQFRSARPGLAAVLVACFLLAGCVEDPADAPGPPGTVDTDGDGYSDAVEAKFGSDPANATSVPDVVRHEDVDYANTVQVVGTGVPSVQCPADDVNSQTMVWNVTAKVGDARMAWVENLTFAVQGEMTVNDVDLFVAGPDGSSLGSGTSGANSETVTVSGTHALGDYTIEVRGCSGAGDATVTGSGTVRWFPSDAELLAAEP
jgi:hypothetical protein